MQERLAPLSNPQKLIPADQAVGQRLGLGTTPAGPALVWEVDLDNVQDLSSLQACLPRLAWIGVRSFPVSNTHTSPSGDHIEPVNSRQQPFASSERMKSRPVPLSAGQDWCAAGCLG